MSQPVVSELVTSNMDADDTVTDSEQHTTCCKFFSYGEKYKHKTNKARREKDIINSLHEKVVCTQNLSQKPLTYYKIHKREVYRSNPSPVRKCGRQVYCINPALACYKDCEDMKNTYTLLRQNLLDRHNLQKLMACAVSKKYKNYVSVYQVTLQSMFKQVTINPFSLKFHSHKPLL